MMGNPADNIYRRYSNQQANFVIVDGKRALIGSTGLDQDSMPWDDKRNGTDGHRGVGIITDAPGVVARLDAVFSWDADPFHHSDLIAADLVAGPPVGYVPITLTYRVALPVYMTAPLALTGEWGFEMVQSPANSLRSAGSMLGLLGRTGIGDIVLAEQAHEPLQWGGPGSSATTDPNLRLVAYIAAARRGARVRLLLDGAAAAVREENKATCNHIHEISSDEQWDLECQLADGDRWKIYNQMLLVKVDGEGYIHIGTLGGSEGGSKANRSLALQVGADEGFGFLAGYFERDWPHLAMLPLVTNGWRAVPQYPLVSEVLFRPASGDALEWIELHNPTGQRYDLVGWSLGDAASPLDREGVHMFPPGASVDPNGALVVAVDGEQYALAHGGTYPDYEFLIRSAVVPDLIRHRSWGRGSLVLGNLGDEVLSLDPKGRVVDVLVWGNGSWPDVQRPPGFSTSDHSLERYPPWLGTDHCGRDFREQAQPNRGGVP
jgi:hypothetical protein